MNDGPKKTQVTWAGSVCIGLQIIKSLYELRACNGSLGYRLWVLSLLILKRTSRYVVLSFSTGIHDMKGLGLDVDLKSVETNMVYFNVNHHTVSANELVKQMLDVTESAPLETRVAVRILTA